MKKAMFVMLLLLSSQIVFAEDCTLKDDSVSFSGCLKIMSSQNYINILKKRPNEWGNLDETWKNLFKNKKPSECITEIKGEVAQKLSICIAAVAVMSFKGSEIYTDYGDLNDTKVSFDGQIRCKGDGVKSQDFPACVDMVNAYDGAFIAENVLHQGQNIKLQNDLQSSQAKNMGSPAASVVGALNVQKDSLSNQADAARVRSAAQLAKAATFYGLIKKMPTITQLEDHCNATVKNLSTTPKVDLDLKTACNTVINGENEKQEFIFLYNQKATDAATFLALKAGADASLFAYQGNLLDKQAGKVQGAIDAVNGYAPPDFSGMEGQELLVEKCQANPNLAECLQGAGGYQGLSGMELNIGGGTGTSSVTQTSPASIDHAITAAGGVVDSPDTIEAIGSVGAVADNARTIDGSVVPGAKSNLANSGGGGGLSVGDPSPPSGGAGSGGGDSPQGIVPGSGAASKVAFEEGNLSTGGGSALKSKKAAGDSGNPFDSLLGKNGENIPKGTSLNFRDPASEKELGENAKSIFERISDGYVKARGNDKLLIYDVQTK